MHERALALALALAHARAVAHALAVAHARRALARALAHARGFAHTRTHELFQDADYDKPNPWMTQKFFGYLGTLHPGATYVCRAEQNWRLFGHLHAPVGLQPEFSQRVHLSQAALGLLKERADAATE